MTLPPIRSSSTGQNGGNETPAIMGFLGLSAAGSSEHIKRKANPRRLGSLCCELSFCCADAIACGFRFRAGHAATIGGVEESEKDPLDFLHDSRVA